MATILLSYIFCTCQTSRCALHIYSMSNMEITVNPTWQTKCSPHGNYGFFNMANVSNFNMVNIGYSTWQVPSFHMASTVHSIWQPRHIQDGKTKGKAHYLKKILLVYIFLICLSIGLYVRKLGCLSVVFTCFFSSAPSIFCCEAVYCLANYSNELPWLM